MKTKTKPTFGEAVGAVVVILAVFVVGYSAIFATNGDAASKTAMIGLLGAGSWYFLRTKLTDPTNPNPPPAASEPPNHPTVIINPPPTPPGLAPRNLPTGSASAGSNTPVTLTRT